MRQRPTKSYSQTNFSWKVAVLNTKLLSPTAINSCNRQVNRRDTSNRVACSRRDWFYFSFSLSFSLETTPMKMATSATNENNNNGHEDCLDFRSMVAKWNKQNVSKITFVSFHFHLLLKLRYFQRKLFAHYFFNIDLPYAFRFLFHFISPLFFALTGRQRGPFIRLSLHPGLFVSRRSEREGGVLPMTRIRTTQS